MLSKGQVRRFYDWWGARQDWQRFFEGPALQALLTYSRLEDATAVFEFGCGPGSLAAKLLADYLPETATYLGYDLSATMVKLAWQRLDSFGERATVKQTDGSVRLDLADNSFDRFVSTYVLDLLPEPEIATLLAEARRIVTPGGRLGLISLSQGQGGLACQLASAWEWLHARRPEWVGGCRPLALLDFIPKDTWAIDHHQMVVTLGITSEVVVAIKRPET